MSRFSGKVMESLVLALILCAPLSAAEIHSITDAISTAPPETVVDLDQYPLLADEVDYPEDWHWQFLPQGQIYPSYLAGTKESRFSASFINVREDGWLLDAVLGTRVGLLRFGSDHSHFPEGFQVDAEGSAQLRLDVPDDIDVRSGDFRAGLPISYAYGDKRWKVGYYHVSSHLGDEFLLKNPGFPRLNFVRDVLIFGHAIYLSPSLRVYAEAGWAFNTEFSEPWEFQFGLDYAPPGPTGLRGAPFFALNGHLREEVDFGGGLTAQAGWAWRSDVSTPLLRAGVHYYNGKSNQFSFFNEHEQQIGMALWYDF